MTAHTLRTLVAKDLTLYFRNRFFAFITVLALVFYALIYFLLPATVDETLEMALFAPSVPPAFAEQLNQEGVILRQMESETALRQAVVDGDVPVGITIPAGWLEGIAAGEAEPLHLFFRADLPAEFQDAYRIILQEMTYAMSGQPLNIRFTEETLGPDLVGEQIPMREQLLPLFAVFILLMETMGLASLISAEVEAHTLQALLVTPLQTGSLFLGKAVTGVGLAFAQAFLLMAVTGGLSREPLLITLALLLGALLATGIAFLIASVARDMMSVMAWGMLAILVLALPAFTVLIPGIASQWLQILPSHYLVDTVYRVANLEAGWADMTGNLLALAAFSVAFFSLGALALRRKFQ